MKTKLFPIAVAAGLLISVTACGEANENLPSGGLQETEQENEPEQVNERGVNDSETEADEEEGDDDNDSNDSNS